jgi:fatty acid desaturase
MSVPIGQETKKKRSLFELIADVPTLVRELVMGEIQHLKVEMIGKFKAWGIGGALIAVAVVFVLYMLGVLLTAAVLGLSYVMPGWLAALLIALLLLVIAAVFALIGYRKLKDGLPPQPTATIESVKRDIDTIKGMAK